jgi:hypothetical protein
MHDRKVATVILSAWFDAGMGDPEDCRRTVDANHQSLAVKEDISLKGIDFTEARSAHR